MLTRGNAAQDQSCVLFLSISSLQDLISWEVYWQDEAAVAAYFPHRMSIAEQWKLLVLQCHHQLLLEVEGARLTSFCVIELPKVAFFSLNVGFRRLNRQVR